MHRTELANGIAVLYGTDLTGSVVICFPNGSEVRTTWAQLGRINTIVEHLRQAYHCLLSQADSDGEMPVDVLLRIDDLLFSLQPTVQPARTASPSN